MSKKAKAAEAKAAEAKAAEAKAAEAKAAEAKAAEAKAAEAKAAEAIEVRAERSDVLIAGTVWVKAGKTVKLDTKLTNSKRFMKHVNYSIECGVLSLVK